jgi:phospholipid/cholesterol/gamma-HCH transport system substrate-binding protein
MRSWWGARGKRRRPTSLGSRAWHRWRLPLATVVALLVGGSAIVLGIGLAEPTRRLVAYFERTVGLYTGSDVRVLGVKIGEVTKITPSGGHVRVDMTYSARFSVPADAEAVLIPPSIVSDRYVQLTPAHHGGPAMADGGEIPLSRTGSPLETDEVFRALNDFTAALGPDGANASGAFSDLIRTGRLNLEGNGANLKATIDGLSTVAAAFADGHDDLFTTLANLQKFTTMLAQSDQQIRSLNSRLAEVATQLSTDRDTLTAMLNHLATALSDVTGFVRDNRAALAGNITALADVTGILVRQQQALAQVLNLAPLTLSNLLLAYNPEHGNLDLRNFLIKNGPPEAGQATGAPPAGVDTASAATVAPAADVCSLLVEELAPAAVPRECVELARVLHGRGQPLSPQLASLLGAAPGPAAAGMYELLLGGGAAGDRTLAGILPGRAP